MWHFVCQGLVINEKVEHMEPPKTKKNKPRKTPKQQDNKTKKQGKKKKKQGKTKKQGMEGQGMTPQKLWTLLFRQIGVSIANRFARIARATKWRTLSQRPSKDSWIAGVNFLGESSSFWGGLGNLGIAHTINSGRVRPRQKRQEICNFGEVSPLVFLNFLQWIFSFFSRFTV